MLKFKKVQTSGTPPTSPSKSSVSSARRPTLITRIDSMGGPVEHERVSLFQESSEEDNQQSGMSSSSEGFEIPDSKLRDVTKRKLNREKKKLMKQQDKKQRNLLSSKDFFSRQCELKIWINETTGKDVNQLSDRKLKEYFKKFTYKWNKRKLPQRYYKGVDLLSTPISAPSAETLSLSVNKSLPADSAKSISSRPTSGLWIAPPIPMIEHLSSDEEAVTSSILPVASSICTSDLPSASASVVRYSTFSSQKFATISKPSPGKPSKFYIEGMTPTVRTPPKPPVRRRPPTIITTLSKGISTESICSLNNIGVRASQPRMGSVISSMRRPSKSLQSQSETASVRADTDAIYTGSYRQEMTSTIDEVVSSGQVEHLETADGGEQSGERNLSSVSSFHVSAKASNDSPPASLLNTDTKPVMTAVCGETRLELPQTDDITGLPVPSTSDRSGDGNTEILNDEGAIGCEVIQGSTKHTRVQDETGDSGIQGATGASGIQDEAGGSGIQGATGDSGIQGATGDSDVQGATGDSDVQGATGDSGIQGTTGDSCVQGATGDIGIQGVLGHNGFQVSRNEVINSTLCTGTARPELAPRQSAEKRSISELPGNDENKRNIIDTSMPPTSKRRTKWVEEVERTEEVFV